MTPTSLLITHCDDRIDFMNRTALGVPAKDPKREESVQYWLGQRDAWASAKRWAQNLLSLEMEIPDVPA